MRFEGRIRIKLVKKERGKRREAFQKEEGQPKQSSVVGEGMMMS